MAVIPKFQQGGGYNTFFTVFNPVPVERPRPERPSGRSSKEPEEESQKGKLTEKDLFDMIEKLDGLPNEMDAITNNLLITLQNAKLLGDSDIQDLAINYVKNLKQLKVGKYNKEQFDATYQRAVENKSLNDIAIDPSGNVWVLDGNNTPITLTTEQWAKLKGTRKYKPLSNGNLLWMRSHLPQYVNQNSLFRIVENGIGLEKVQDLVKSSFKDIGKMESSYDQYLPKDVAMGMDIIKNLIAAGPDGYYKVSQSLTQADNAQIDATLSYIYSMLPGNAKTRLAAETPNGTQEQVCAVIRNMILGTVDTKQTYNVNFAGASDLGTPKSGAKDGKGSTGDEDNYATKVIKGYGTPEIFGINLGDPNLTRVQANTMPIAGKDDKELGIGAPMSAVMQSSLGSQLDTRSAFLGGSLVNPLEFNHIINRDGKVRTIDYPCTVNENGTVVPNISKEFKEKKAKAEERLRKQGIDANNTNINYIAQHHAAINQAYEAVGLSAPYSPDGTLKSSNWARFAIFAVSTDKTVIEDNLDKSLVRKLTDKQAEATISAIKAVDEQYDKSTGIFGGTDFYDGVLWIRLLPGYNAATATIKADESVTRQRDERDQAIATRVQLTTKSIKK